MKKKTQKNLSMLLSSFILEWGAEEGEAGMQYKKKKKAGEEGMNMELWQQRPAERMSGREEKKINTQALPVIFLFGDRINILHS